MNIQTRVRFSASLSSTGNVVPGAAEASYALPSTGSYWYLLTKATDWEIGYVDDTITGTKRRPFLNSSVNFADSTTGLTCTLIEAPYSMSACTPGSSGTPVAPIVNDTAFDSIAQGCGSEASSPDSVAIGALAYIPGSAEKSTALGSNATVAAPLGSAIGAFSGTVAPGSALGAFAQNSNPGESAIGSSYAPHIAFLPVKAPSGVSAGGTFTFLAVTGEIDGGLAQLTGSLTSLFPNRPSAAYMVMHHRIQGTIVCEGTDTGDTKVFDLDIMVMNGTVVYSTVTNKYNGANNVAYTLSLNGSGHLQIVSPAITGLKVTGLLQITKILVS